MNVLSLLWRTGKSHAMSRAVWCISLPFKTETQWIFPTDGEEWFSMVFFNGQQTHWYISGQAGRNYEYFVDRNWISMVNKTQLATRNIMSILLSIAGPVNRVLPLASGYNMPVVGLGTYTVRSSKKIYSQCNIRRIGSKWRGATSVYYYFHFSTLQYE